MMSLLKKFVENVYVNLISGLLLFISAAIEIVQTLDTGTIGAHHGIAVFALVKIFKDLNDFHHGAEYVAKFRD